jgi:hypothetical protein
MTWTQPPVPVPLLALPRAEGVVLRFDSVSVALTDRRLILVPFSYSQRLEDAPLAAQQRVMVTSWGMLLVWPDVPFSVTIRRLLLDARAEHSPWGDPPTVLP